MKFYSMHTLILLSMLTKSVWYNGFSYLQITINLGHSYFFHKMLIENTYQKYQNIMNNVSFIFASRIVRISQNQFPNIVRIDTKFTVLLNSKVSKIKIFIHKIPNISIQNLKFISSEMWTLWELTKECQLFFQKRHSRDLSILKMYTWQVARLKVQTNEIKRKFSMWKRMKRKIKSKK